jgi:large subunit ribosomal protein L7Ae
LALTEVRREDYQDFETLTKTFEQLYNQNDKLRKTWGGGVMGIKNQHMMTAREKVREIER